MIRFDWHGICCIVDFSFFVFAACVGLQCGSLWFCLLLSACFLHELGHLLAMLLFHQKIRSVAVRGVGIVITPVPAYDAYWKDIVIWLAGPAANFVAGLGAFLLGENAYAILHLGLCIFNLFPYASLDGGAVFKSMLLARGMMPQTVFFVLSCISVIFTGIVIAFLTLYRVWNPSLCVMLVYLLVFQFVRGFD